MSDYNRMLYLPFRLKSTLLLIGIGVGFCAVAATDQIAIAPASLTVDENALFAHINVTRSGTNSSAASIYVSTSDGTAMACTDFTTTRGTLSWEAGESGARQVRVPILNDGLVESNESFDVRLSNAIGSFTLGNGQTQVQIIDDDSGDPGLFLCLAAEDAILGGDASLVNKTANMPYGGAGYINLPPDGGSATWANVDGGTGCAATLGFRYALGGGDASRECLVRINGVARNVIFYSTGAWSSWMIYDLGVQLGAGSTNTIAIESIGNDGPNVDLINLAMPGNPEESPPTIDTFEQHYSAAAGDALVLSLNASGPGTLRYQWFHEDQPVGTDTNTLTMDPVGAADIGEYRVVVSNAFGSVTSDPMSLELIWTLNYAFGSSTSNVRLRHNGQTMDVTYPVARPDATYLTESCTDLTVGHWNSVDYFIADGQTFPSRTVNLPDTGDSNRFFRVRAFKTTDAVSAMTKQPNILFISIDDLNDFTEPGWMNADVLTPNLDRLAQRGLFFSDAQCNYTICGPSRASLMSGFYPHTLGYNGHMKDEDLETRTGDLGTELLHSYFARHEYRTMAVGKVCHKHVPSGSVDASGGRGGMSDPTGDLFANYHHSNTQTDWSAVPDSLEPDFPDYQAADWAINQLSLQHDRPFMLMVGFMRPHVPFYAPQRYFDRYDPEAITLPPYLPGDLDDLPSIAQSLVRPEMPRTEWAIANNQWRNIVHSYLACISFADEQVGRVLDALENSPYRDDTIIVLWSDHGYHMGEKNTFQKHALWERSTHVPLLFVGPSIPEGIRCSRVVSLLDIYPTLVELTNLPINSFNEGRSLVPLINNPSIEWPHPALTEFEDHYAVRNERYRYIRYTDGSEELYDHATDPDEWINLAGQPEYAAIKAELAAYIP